MVGAELPVSEFYSLALVLAGFLFIFAAGKLADAMLQSGRKMTRKEALAAPFAYLFTSAICVFFYFASGMSTPPQNTLISNGVFLVLLPLAIATIAGALAIHAFFHDTLKITESLHLSMQIILAPLFDGLYGYWTALGAAALLVAISGITFWSSGGNFSLITTDFLLLSAVVSAYYLYKLAVSQKNSDRASNLIIAVILIVPGALRLFFRDIACSLLSLIPLQFFKACPLYQTGNEVTLALSVLATLVLIVPVIPVVYAAVVNLMRAGGLLGIILENGQPRAKKKEDG